MSLLGNLVYAKIIAIDRDDNRRYHKIMYILQYGLDEDYSANGRSIRRGAPRALYINNIQGFQYFGDQWFSIKEGYRYNENYRQEEPREGLFDRNNRSYRNYRSRRMAV